MSDAHEFVSQSVAIDKYKNDRYNAPVPRTRRSRGNVNDLSQTRERMRASRRGAEVQAVSLSDLGGRISKRYGCPRVFEPRRLGEGTATNSRMGGGGPSASKAHRAGSRSHHRRNGVFRF